MRLIQAFVTLIFLLSIGLSLYSQNSDTSCYYFRSKFYKGDFIQLCLISDSTFYYQRHQNDVFGDYFSTGEWFNIADTIILKSINSNKLNYELIQSGSKYCDSLKIQVFYKVDMTPVPYANIVFLDTIGRMIYGKASDSNGYVELFINDKAHIMEISCAGCGKFKIDFISINNSELKIVIDTEALIFQDLSDYWFIRNKRGDLLEFDSKGRPIIYKLEKN